MILIFFYLKHQNSCYSQSHPESYPSIDPQATAIPCPARHPNQIASNHYKAVSPCPCLLGRRRGRLWVFGFQLKISFVPHLI